MGEKLSKQLLRKNPLFLHFSKNLRPLAKHDSKEVASSNGCNRTKSLDVVL
jgi:hypothetical protein